MSTRKNPLPEFKVPEFRPLIPEHMLQGIKDDNTKYIIEQLSVVTQQGQWQTHKLMNIYEYTEGINGKVIELDQFRTDIQTEAKIQAKLKKEKTSLRNQYKSNVQNKKKLYIGAAAVFILLVYPVYLAFVDSNGLGSVIKSFF